MRHYELSLYGFHRTSTGYIGKSAMIELLKSEAITV